MSVFTLAITCLTNSNLPQFMDLTFQDLTFQLHTCCNIAFSASDLASITSPIHNWVWFLLWLSLFILSGVISPLIPSRYGAPTDLGSSPFSVLTFFLSYCSWGSQGKNTEVVCHSLSSGTHFVRTLHHDPCVLCGLTSHGS